MDTDNIEILLVEDNMDDAALTIRALKKNKLADKLFHVKDGAEAIDFLFAKGIYEGRGRVQPKIILLDFRMPKLSGVEVLEILKADISTRHIPIIMLTSSKEEPDIKKCYQLGVNSYIVKPVDFDEFENVVAGLGIYWMHRNQPAIRAGVAV